MQKLWYPCLALPCLALPCARLTPPLPSALCYPGLFLSITMLRCSEGDPKETTLDPPSGSCSPRSSLLLARNWGEERRELTESVRLLQSELTILRKLHRHPRLTQPLEPHSHPWGAGLQPSPHVPQPWLFDQGLEREQNPVVSVLLSNHIVFVEIQLPASTQELIAGILYLTLVFNKRR